jgi:beta-glucosidase
MAQATLHFPSDFLWGTSTSAYQVEGLNPNSDWHAFELSRGVADDPLLGCGPSCDWWADAESDLDIAAEMGTNAHRLSLEWSRIEPEPSVFDREAIDRYRAILQACHARGLEPMVTLWHFSNPLWLVEKGDFNSDVVVDYFRRYVSKVVDELGDLIPKWITINEPLNYVFLRYLDNAFPPPSERGYSAAMEALVNLLRCHAAAYHTIKAGYPDAPVSAASAMNIITTRPRNNVLDRWFAGKLSHLYNDAWNDAMQSGRLWTPLGTRRVKEAAGTFDFIGLNYYTRFYVRFPPKKGIVEREWEPGAVLSDGNYGEVYPHGLYELMAHVTNRYGKPVYITENGAPDAADRIRPGFILDHLRQVWHAISFCYPIMGYYHWSLVDNYEWERGWTQRFGLVEVDPGTQARRWRRSAYLYQEICRTYSISSDMAEQYAPEMLDVMFPG